MGKKRFIDPKNSVTFAVVHRSQKDSRICDDEASKYVLKPLPPSSNLQKKGFNPQWQYEDIVDAEQLISDDSFDSEDENQILNNLNQESKKKIAYDGFDRNIGKNDPSNYGIYFKNDDDYDYFQHLKQMGEDPSSVFIAAKTESNKKEEKGIKFVSEEDGKALDAMTSKKKISIPLDVFPSTELLDCGLLNQPKHSAGFYV